MIVDDEYMIHLSLNKLIQLMDDKFTIISEAEDGMEAYQLLLNSPPDIVITDIHMPEMDGLEFIQKTKRIYPYIKFIIISGYNDFEYAQKAIRFGVSDFLLKPIEPDQFIKTMKKIYHELKGTEQSIEKHNSWILSLESYQQELVSHIWSVDKEKTLACIDCILTHFEKENINQPLSHFLENLLLYVNQELLKRNVTLSDEIFLHTEWSTAFDKNRLRIHSIIELIIQEVRGFRNLGSRQNILRAAQYMKENFSEENLSLQKVATHIGVSEAYFSRTFKEEMNISFIKYLITLRLEKAKELLLETDIKTIDIAFNVGFSDYPHFSKTFKKYYGVTPSELRKQLKAGNAKVVLDPQ